MDSREFEKRLKKELMSRAGKLKGQVIFKPAVKGNKEVNTVQYFPKNGQCGVSIDLEHTYLLYCFGQSIEEIAEKLISDLKNSERELPDINLSEDIIRPERIIPVLIPSEGNEALLGTVPHIPFEDLQIIFKINAPEIKDGCTANVTYEYMEQNGWSKEQLLEIALKNAIFRENIELIPFESYALERQAYTGKDDLSCFSELAVPMVTVTNKDRCFGAAGILDKEIMDKIAGAFGEDLYIIPDSIHDCVVVPKSEYPEAELEEHSFGRSPKAVHAQEWLSDELYYFDRLTREITRFAGRAERQRSMEIKPSDQCRK